MESQVSPGQYRDVVLFLATAGIIVPLFRRWRISPILGFLAAGVLLGPSGLGSLSGRVSWLRYLTIEKPAEVAQLAEFGVVFLLFMIGLELSWARLKAMRRYVFGLGALQVALCAAAIAGAAMLVGQGAVGAAGIGAALALSSTAIVMPSLAEHKRQHSLAGRAVFSVLLFQDLAVAPVLITLAILGAHGGGEGLSPHLLLAFAPAGLAVVALLVFGRLLLRPMLRSVARAKSEELFMAASLLVVVGAGLVSALAGLSMALGAFIAGLLLAETEYRRQVEVIIEPFKGLLLGLFFLSTGIGLDLSQLVAQPWQILGAALAVIVLKAAVVFVSARCFGLPQRNAAEAGLLLAGGGEFAFVIVAASIADGLVSRQVGQFVLVASTLSMMAIPLLAAAGLRMGGRPTTSELPERAGPPGGEDERRVLVVGYGRVGRVVGEMLRRHATAWVAAERDPRLVESGRRAGEAIVFGDASRPEFLKRCGLEDATALVVTMDDPEAVEMVVAIAREMRPDLKIIARARDARQAERLYGLGATDAVPETVEASLQISESLLVELGVPMGPVIASIHERREEFRKVMKRPKAPGAGAALPK